MMPLYRRSALAVLVGFGAACGGDTPIDPPTPCTAEVTVTATANPLPYVTWSPECGAGRVSMHIPPSQGLTPLWYIASSESQIRSGVRYGEVPTGATEVTPAQPILSGSTVIVGVFTLNNKLLGSTQVKIP